ncbi:fer-1-like protein 5 [Grus japonensis]|uniref:Fer-1-like protein 5 n=1 Tax=Grus japonensis TaxID=30415 RepID=A0ABC9XRY1_GRUJA
MLRLLVASAHIPGPTGSGPGVHVSARFRGVPRSTRVVPEERSPTWNETLAWPLGAHPLHPTASLTLRLRHWGQPAPRGDLGTTTVSLDRLVADPSLPLALSHVPLLDPRGQPTGVRVRIIEGHQLQGNDIKPVVTVLIGQHRFRTRIRVGNNPYYNEVFFQNFHQTPAQLAAEPICIQVLDSRATRAEAVIGTFQLPPICDEIQLAILSGSRSSKVLGTATLHLSQISFAGAELEEGTPGFLPCFGPSFLPFYGPRTDPARTPSTDTRVAYRGRVLLELSTLMGTPDGCQRDTIAPEDIARVQRHLPRHRFGLCGVFYSATMVPAGPELLRFELSLGNYGDTGDVTCKPAASVTPHGCPLFDGNRYHYLPWYADKPVVAVTSSWEDAGHRWDALNLLRAVCRRLPQAGMPDVLLWLLRGEQRVACARVPAPDLMFSRSGPSASGRLCGRIQTLFLVGSGDIRAQLRLRLWLGRVADSRDLPRHLEGTLRVYAETYENQTKLLGKWGPRGLLGRPGFSDSTGKAALPRHRIRPPKGWCWDGPWTVEPQRRLLLDMETNVGEVLEEVYENESRPLGGEWGPAAVASTDASGMAVPPKEEVACPQGWHVTDGWRVDVTGAVDEAGSNFFQLRCYIFQALELAPRSTKATADPVAHVSFVHVSQSTRVLPGTLDPLWDQTLLFHRLLLYGDPQGVRDEPPAVVVEVFDQDRGVLAWGLRGLRSSVRAPSLEVQCGGQTLRTPTIADLAANPNFPINAFLLMLVRMGGVDRGRGAPHPRVLLLAPQHDSTARPQHLPAEEEYMPPIRLRVLDTQDFGYRPEAVKEEEEEDEDENDWWSKFYAATGDKAKSWQGTKRDRLKIYSCELEAVPEFEGLQDFCQTFPLYQPGGHPAVGEDPVPVGEFKGLFHIYPLPEDPGVPPPPRHFQELPPSQPQKCLVRVYIIRAFDLPPRDRNGLCDPYVRVSLGMKTLGQRDQYVPNTLEPVFGRLFEVTGTIPLEKDLQVSLLDYDLLPPDQEIGSTTIDLENRLLSRFRAHCGLPTFYRTYELRCVVWNTRDVDLGDTNLAGQQMSDIYVTGWLDGLEEQRQKTDVHYRSLQGDGVFNWRFIFSFEYLVAEQLCVLPHKEHFWSLDEKVLKVPPKLILQVWDNDKFSADDFLGVLELELTQLPQPTKHPQNCTPTPLGTPQRPWPWRGARASSPLSLFRQRRGKLELSLELLTAKEAEERPAGKGREDPNMYPTLPAPVRPEWSFLWLQAPLRSLRYSIWRHHRCRISLGLALLLLLALLLTFIYATPGYLAMKLVNPLQSLHLAGGEHPAAGTGKP